MKHPEQKGMTYIDEGRHPSDDMPGSLYQVDATGIYLLDIGGSFRSVPRCWAADIWLGSCMRRAVRRRLRSVFFSTPVRIQIDNAPRIIAPTATAPRYMFANNGRFSCSRS